MTRGNLSGASSFTDIDDGSAAVAGRVARGSGAYAANTVVFVAFQLISIPIFLYKWTDTLYGNWLLFFTLPAYLSFVDLGLQAGVGSSMSVHVANGRHLRAGRELQAYLKAMVLASAVVCALAAAALVVVPIERLLRLTAMTHRAAVLVGLCMVAYGALALLSGVTSAGYKSVGQFPRQMMFVTVMRVVEYSVLLGLVLVNGDPVVAAMGFLAARACMTYFLFLDFRRHTPWLRREYGGGLRALRPLVGPSVAYLGFPVGYVLQNQGMLLVANMIAPAQVVVLNTTRTVTNSFYQLFVFLGAGALPELSRALGQGRLTAARKLQGTIARMTLTLAVFLGLVVMVAGPWVLRLWTSGRVNPGWVALGVLMLSALTDCVWNACLPVLVAVNRHVAVGTSFALSAGLALPIAYLLFPPLGLAGVGVALFTTSVFVTVVAVAGTARLLEVPQRDVLKSFLARPATVLRDLGDMLHHVRPRYHPVHAYRPARSSRIVAEEAEW